MRKKLTILFLLFATIVVNGVGQNNNDFEVTISSPKVVVNAETEIEYLIFDVDIKNNTSSRLEFVIPVAFREVQMWQGWEMKIQKGGVDISWRQSDSCLYYTTSKKKLKKNKVIRMTFVCLLSEMLVENRAGAYSAHLLLSSVASKKVCKQTVASNILLFDM